MVAAGQRGLRWRSRGDRWQASVGPAQHRAREAQETPDFCGFQGSPGLTYLFFFDGCTPASAILRGSWLPGIEAPRFAWKGRTMAARWPLGWKAWRGRVGPQVSFLLGRAGPGAHGFFHSVSRCEGCPDKLNRSESKAPSRRYSRTLSSKSKWRTVRPSWHTCPVSFGCTWSGCSRGTAWSLPCLPMTCEGAGLFRWSGLPRRGREMTIDDGMMAQLKAAPAGIRVAALGGNFQ
jgi:hypothetical protein